MDLGAPKGRSRDIITGTSEMCNGLSCIDHKMRPKSKGAVTPDSARDQALHERGRDRFSLEGGSVCPTERDKQDRARDRL